MMLIAGYAGAVLMGLSLGLIGGGGSILTVPILVYLFGYSPAMATIYSLFQNSLPTPLNVVIIRKSF